MLRVLRAKEVYGRLETLIEILKPTLLGATSGRAYLNGKDVIRYPKSRQRQGLPSAY